jgi:hypothetical protein
MKRCQKVVIAIAAGAGFLAGQAFGFGGPGQGLGNEVPVPGAQVAGGECQAEPLFAAAHRLGGLATLGDVKEMGDDMRRAVERDDLDRAKDRAGLTRAAPRFGLKGVDRFPRANRGNDVIASFEIDPK